ncbi:deoxycytidine triphosphate deaminase [Bradyrhizobium sp. LA6.7]|uniref:dCTP deaminase domain-containing protein n=1 Tax=unclassified Bradyrhizobium TaxID=2631580 RepID=UPI00339747E3
MFWGGLRLRDELPNLITDYTDDRIDGAAYRLRVGPEVYVSPTGEADDPRNKPKTQLKKGQGFTVPAGQFGFILTEENVKVPPTAIAFISMRAKYKFQGLVNVSGFHVDPNYDDRLIFSVFNAGPGPVHLSQGEECFLIFYATLDRPEEVDVKKGYNSIPSHLTGPLAGGLQSFAGLLSKINENDKKVSDRVNTLEREQSVLKWAIALAVGALISVGLRDCSFTRQPDQTKAGISAPASPTPAARTP